MTTQREVYQRMKDEGRSGPTIRALDDDLIGAGHGGKCPDCKWNEDSLVVQFCPCRSQGTVSDDWATAYNVMHETVVRCAREAKIRVLPVDQEKIHDALDWCFLSAQVDGAHHKMWVIDQMVRSLTGDNYDEWVKIYRDGEDGPETYEWDTGIVP